MCASFSLHAHLIQTECSALVRKQGLPGKADRPQGILIVAINNVVRLSMLKICTRIAKPAGSLPKLFLCQWPALQWQFIEQLW